MAVGLPCRRRLGARVIVAVVVEVPAEQWGRLAERRRARRGGEVVLQRRFLLAAVRFLQAGDGEAQGGDLVRALERCRLESGNLVRQAIKMFDQRKQGFEGGGLRGEFGDLGGEVGESGEHLVDGRLQGFFSPASAMDTEPETPDTKMSRVRDV